MESVVRCFECDEWVPQDQAIHVARVADGNGGVETLYVHGEPCLPFSGV